MLFIEVIQAIRPHLMKDADAPTFMRNIIQMLCDIPEEDWYTGKDPSSDVRYKDSSLSKFYNRGISKKLAKSMLGRLTREQFVDSIQGADREDVVLEGLVSDITPFLDEETAASTTVDNVGERLFDLFNRALEEVINPAQANERKLNKAKTRSASAKADFGDGLIRDCGSACSMPGCGKSLVLLDGAGKSLLNYEVLMIEGEGKQEYNNLLAVCNDCFSAYELSHKKADERELKAVKRLQAIARRNMQITDEIAVEDGILLVIKKLMQAKAQDYQDLVYDPVAVSTKIDERENELLVAQVRLYVNKYYIYIGDTMKSLAMENKYSDDLVRAEVKAIYQQLERKRNTPNQIFSAFVDRFVRITKQDPLYCGVLVAYFIQSCEVFHASTK